MNRQVKSNRLKVRILNFTTTSNTSTCTATAGSDDATFTSGGTGLHTITLKRGFAYTPAVLSGADNSNVLSQGGARVYSKAKTGCTIKTVTASDTADDGTAHTLIIGQDTSDYNKYAAAHLVVGSGNNPTLFGFKFVPSAAASTLTPTIGKGHVASTSYVAAGNYTINLSPAFSTSKLTVICSPISATSNRQAYASVTSAGVISVKTFASGSLADNNSGFYMVVAADNSRNPAWGKYRPYISNFREPRIIALQLGWSGGVVIFNDALNYDDVTSYTDNGTGDVTINLKEKFRSEPVVIATPNVAGAVYPSTDATSSAVRLVAFSSVPAASDLASFSVLILGSDTPDNSY